MAEMSPDQIVEIMTKVLRSSDMGGQSEDTTLSRWMEHWKSVEKERGKTDEQILRQYSAAQKALNEYTKRADQNATATRETLKNLRHDIKDSGLESASKLEASLKLQNKLFQHAKDSFQSIEHVNEQLVPRLQEALKGAIKDHTQMFDRAQFDTLSDIEAVRDQLEQYQKLLFKLKSVAEEGLSLEEQKQQVYNHAIEQLGLSAEQAQYFVDHLEEMPEVIENATTSLNTLTAKAAGAGEGLADMIPSLAASTFGLRQFAQEALDSAQSSARFGGQLENMFGSALWGMTSAELSELQGQYRQTTLAFSRGTGTIDRWEQRINENMWTMAAFTGGLKESIQMNAQLVDIQRTLGTNSANTAGFLNQQQNMFKNWNRVFGVTVDQFQSMNDQLMQSSSVRTQLFKLNQDQRKAYFKDLQLTYQRLRSQGMLHEQALQTAEALSEMGGQSAKERIEQAAKLQAVMGAIGMPGRGAEAAQLLRGGFRGEGDQQRMAQLMAPVQGHVSEMMARGLGTELRLDEMIKATGLEKYIGPDSAFADAEIQQRKAVVKNVEATQDLTGELTKLRKQLETGPAGLTGGVAGAGQLVTTLFSGATGGLLSAALVSGITRMFTTRGFGGMLGKVSRMFGGGLGRGSPTRTRYTPTTLTNTPLRQGITTTGMGTRTAGGAAATSARGTGGIVSQMGKGSILGRMGGRIGARALPGGIGTAIGLGLAGEDIMQGDWLGAGLNTGAALASWIPGIGTPLAMGLAGLDMAREGGKTTSGAGGQDKTDLLIQLLREIEENTRDNKQASENISEIARRNAREQQQERERQRTNEDIETLKERRNRAFSRLAAGNPTAMGRP